MKISYILPITAETGVRLTDTTCALKYLDETIESVLKQSIPNWELIIVVQASLMRDVQSIINELSYLSIDLKSRIEKQTRAITTRSKNNAIACNLGLNKATGKFIASIQMGDRLAEHASYELIKQIVENPKTQFIYTDHDYIDLNGQRFKPFFKPDLSPDLLYCQNYINNLVAIKKTLLHKIGGWDRKFDSAYGYHLNLNAIANIVKLDRPNPKLLGNQSPVKHIPQILYHERVKLKIELKRDKCILPRPNKKDEESQSKQGLKIIRDFFKIQNRNIKVTQVKPKLYRHHWSVSNPQPLVSLIIPTRDGYHLLKNCIESIIKKTTYKNYELLIVDNQSSNLKTINYMNYLEGKYNFIKILKYNKPFNYSAITNRAVSKANGKVIGLINNDIEVISPNWLTDMVSHAVRPEIGCVGAMLYYSDKTIQHAGVVIGMHGVADHLFKGVEDKPKNDYFNYLSSIRNPKAVTAATLLVKKEIFWKVSGFDEKYLKITFNDVDFCLQVLRYNYLNIVIPTSKLIHHESATRKFDKLSNLEKIEAEYLKRKYDIRFRVNGDIWN